jgi:hypothetical protein
LQGLLEPGELGLAASHLLGIRLCLGNTHLLQLAKLLVDRIELSLGAIAV